MELVRINSHNFFASTIFAELVNKIIDYNEYSDSNRFIYFFFYY